MSLLKWLNIVEHIGNTVEAIRRARFLRNTEPHWPSKLPYTSLRIKSEHTDVYWAECPHCGVHGRTFGEPHTNYRWAVRKGTCPYCHRTLWRPVRFHPETMEEV